MRVSAKGSPRLPRLPPQRRDKRWSATSAPPARQVDAAALTPPWEAGTRTVREALVWAGAPDLTQSRGGLEAAAAP